MSLTPRLTSGFTRYFTRTFTRATSISKLKFKSYIVGFVYNFLEAKNRSQESSYPSCSGFIGISKGITHTIDSGGAICSVVGKEAREVVFFSRTQSLETDNPIANRYISISNVENPTCGSSIHLRLLKALAVTILRNFF
jgi:hypothetical protein